MRVTFLGTGGGRVVTTNQMRATGGFIIELNGDMVSVDPGPGALVKAVEMGIDLRKLTGVIITHAHQDHQTDAEVIIQAMTDSCHVKRGFLIATGHAMNGGDSYRPSVGEFYFRFLERREILSPGKTLKFSNFEVTGTPTKHDEDRCAGFVIRGKESFGYTSDGEYFPGLEKHFAGVDCLVLNVLLPGGISWKGHMNSNGAVRVISAAKPKTAMITHFGMKMLQAGPEKEAAWIERETGIKTIPATDGETYSFGKENAKSLKRISWKAPPVPSSGP